MIVSQRSLVFACLIFFTLGHFTSGLTCYRCLACSTIDGSTGTVTVADNAGYSCYKLTASVGGASTVSRDAILGCSSNGYSVGSVSESTSCCTTDKCNTGSPLSNSSSLVYLVMAIGMILRGCL